MKTLQNFKLFKYNLQTYNMKYDVEALKKLAQNSDVNFRHAAFLVKNNIIFSSGYNKFVTKYGTIRN